MRKHLSRYLTDYAGARAWRNRLVRVETAAELERVLAALEEQAVV
jgi:tRNA-dihydrouridine synthase